MCEVHCFNCIFYDTEDCQPVDDEYYAHPDWRVYEWLELQASECKYFCRKCGYCKQYESEDEVCRLDK